VIDPYQNGNYHRVPNDTHLVLKSVYTQSVFGCLLQHCYVDWHCYPGQDVLAQGLMSIKQVQRATNELKNKGIVSITVIRLKGGGVRLEYDIHIARLFELIEKVHTTDSPVDTQSSGHTVQPTRLTVVSGVPTHTTDSPSNKTNINKTNINNISTPLVVPPKLSDKKKNVEKTNLSDELKNIITAYEKCGGVISTPMIAERLSDAEKEYGAEIIIAGFKKASDSGVHGIGIINYCRPIWRDFKDNGIPQNKSRGGNGARSDHPAGDAAPVDNGQKWKDFQKGGAADAK
jgi:hypothetical protein